MFITIHDYSYICTTYVHMVVTYTILLFFGFSLVRTLLVTPTSLWVTVFFFETVLRLGALRYDSSKSNVSGCVFYAFFWVYLNYTARQTEGSRKFVL